MMFQNHSYDNSVLKKHQLLSMLKTAVLLNILKETMRLFLDFLN